MVHLDDHRRFEGYSWNSGGRWRGKTTTMSTESWVVGGLPAGMQVGEATTHEIEDDSGEVEVRQGCALA
jgi:hypothetical protein